MSYESVSLILGALVVVYTLAAIRRRIEVLGRCPLPPPLLHYPSLTVIRPIRGLDPGTPDNLAAALDNGYAGEIETIFVFDDDQEPALPLAYAAIAEHQRRGLPGRAQVLIAGPPQNGRTGKLNAMLAGLNAAHGELLGFADSDTRPDREALHRLVTLLLTTPGAGAAFAAVTVSEPPQALGDVGYALMLNALYSPQVRLWAQRQNDLPFIMGQLMILRREAVAAIGGLDCADGQLVDDMYLGARLTAAGYKNVMSLQPVRIIDWGMGVAEFSRTYRRWIAFSRTGLPWTFCLSAAQPYLGFWLGLAGVAVALGSGHPLAAIMPLGLAIVIGIGLLRLNRAAGGAPLPWQWSVAPYLLLLGGPFIYLAQLLWPEVRWRGRAYGLNRQARLAPAPPLFVTKFQRLLQPLRDATSRH